MEALWIISLALAEALATSLFTGTFIYYICKGLLDYENVEWSKVTLVTLIAHALFIMTVRPKRFTDYDFVQVFFTITTIAGLIGMVKTYIKYRTK